LFLFVLSYDEVVCLSILNSILNVTELKKLYRCIDEYFSERKEAMTIELTAKLLQYLNHRNIDAVTIEKDTRQFC